MWILFASLNPLAESFRNVFSKKASKKADPLLIAWYNNLIPLICFFPFIFFVELKFTTTFFVALTISGFINIAAVILYHRAISKGDISLVVPMLSFTPLFLLFTSPLIVGEFPDEYGLAGIILIVIGSYLLNSKEKGIIKPLTALVYNKATRYMLIVALIWSVSANYDKVALKESSIIQFVVFINIFVFSGITIFALAKKKLTKETIKSDPVNLIFIGAFTALAYFFHMNALSLTLVAYVIAIKRMSGPLTVLFGHIFLKEDNIKERLLGSLIMLAGVFLIVLG